MDEVMRDSACAQLAFQEYQNTKTGLLATSPIQALAYLPMDCFSEAHGQEELELLLDEHLPKDSYEILSRGVAVQYEILRRLLKTPAEASAVVSPVSL